MKKSIKILSSLGVLLALTSCSGTPVDTTVAAERLDAANETLEENKGIEFIRTDSMNLTIKGQLNSDNYSNTVITKSISRKAGILKDDTNAVTKGYLKTDTSVNINSQIKGNLLGELEGNTNESATYNTMDYLVSDTVYEYEKAIEAQNTPVETYDVSTKASASAELQSDIGVATASADFSFDATYTISSLTTLLGEPKTTEMFGKTTYHYDIDTEKLLSIMVKDSMEESSTVTSLESYFSIKASYVELTFKEDGSYFKFSYNFNVKASASLATISTSLSYVKKGSVTISGVSELSEEIPSDAELNTWASK